MCVYLVICLSQLDGLTFEFADRESRTTRKPGTRTKVKALKDCFKPWSSRACKHTLTLTLAQICNPEVSTDIHTRNTHTWCNWGLLSAKGPKALMMVL